MLQQQHLDGAGQNPSGKTDPESGKPNFELKRLGARPDSVELVEQGLKGELIFNTLTGAGKDNFNKVMSAAEKQLKQGNFYNAADRYRVAVEIDPENPTIRLGLAAALFGAGESLGSAIQLRRAMEMFPPVIVTRLKMIRKMPTEALKRKLDEIYKRLEGRTGTNVNPQLAMLATYMHLGAGEDYVAQKCAVKLKGAAGDDKLYQAFATYVISGKRPAALETTTTKPAGDK